MLTIEIIIKCWYFKVFTIGFHYGSSHNYSWWHLVTSLLASSSRDHHGIDLGRISRGSVWWSYHYSSSGSISILWSPFYSPSRWWSAPGYHPRGIRRSQTRPPRPRYRSRVWWMKVASLCSRDGSTRDGSQPAQHRSCRSIRCWASSKCSGGEVYKVWMKIKDITIWNYICIFILFSFSIQT